MNAAAVGWTATRVTTRAIGFGNRDLERLAGIFDNGLGFVQGVLTRAIAGFEAILFGCRR